jgi:hypothetical protein
MRSRLLMTILQSVGLLMAAVIQIHLVYWSLLFSQRIDLLLFDIATLRIATIEIILGIVSGFLIIVSIFPWSAQMVFSKTADTVIVLSILIPAIAVAIKGIAAVTGFGLFPMNFMPVWNWAIFSQTPSLWLGIALARLIYRFKV